MGLAGAQLIESNRTLYLFSGYSYSKAREEEENSVEYFLGLCALELWEEEWYRIDTNESFGGYANGGSCLYNNNIYYFFGSFFNKWGMNFNDDIYKLGLDNIELDGLK